MAENIIASVNCPCCGELIPVRIDLICESGEDLVKITGESANHTTPFPIVELSMDLDLDMLKDGGLDKLIEDKRRFNEFISRKPARSGRKAKKPKE